MTKWAPASFNVRRARFVWRGRARCSRERVGVRLCAQLCQTERRPLPVQPLRLSARTAERAARTRACGRAQTVRVPAPQRLRVRCSAQRSLALDTVALLTHTPARLGHSFAPSKRALSLSYFALIILAIRFPQIVATKSSNESDGTPVVVGAVRRAPQEVYDGAHHWLTGWLAGSQVTAELLVPPLLARSHSRTAKQS